MLLKDKTIWISGGSRGIGLAIAKRFARDGANIIIAAKTAAPHTQLPGTIYTACEEIESEGGKALPVQTDIRFPEQIEVSMQQGAEHFGGIDIIINNASAIYLLGPQVLKMKQYDLMFSVNARGSYVVNTMALQYLKESNNPHILTLSPPIDMDTGWFGQNIAYVQAKYLMSMNTVGFATLYKSHEIAVNSLWPKTLINTEAVRHISPDLIKHSRKPEIMADAAYVIVTRAAKNYSGCFFIDESVLLESGAVDFDQYQVDHASLLMRDLFIGDSNEALQLIDVVSGQE